MVGVPIGDFYKITANGNKTIEIETSTPAQRSVRSAMTLIRSFDSTTPLATSSLLTTTGRQTAIMPCSRYKVPKNGGGTFSTLRWRPLTHTAEPTKGEYILSVKGANAPKDSLLGDLSRSG